MSYSDILKETLPFDQEHMKVQDQEYKDLVAEAMVRAAESFRQWKMKMDAEAEQLKKENPLLYQYLIDTGRTLERILRKRGYFGNPDSE